MRQRTARKKVHTGGGGGGIHAGYYTQFSRQNVNASSFIKEVRLASENVEEFYCSVCVFSF